MSGHYQNVVLTIIAVLLGAIVAKLYIPSAQHIGPRTSFPTRAELMAAGKAGDTDQVRLLNSQAPVVWLAGGSVDAEITNTVGVTGEVAIERRRSLDRVAIDSYFSPEGGPAPEGK